MKWLFLAIFLFAYAFAGMDMCETAENLRTGDGKQKYYLRYVLKVKYEEENSFSEPEHGAIKGYYLSFDKEPQVELKNKKDLVVGEKGDDFATFTVRRSDTDIQGFRVFSKYDQNWRVLALSYGRFLISIDDEYFQKPGMYLDLQRNEGYSHFDFNRQTGTLIGAFPLGITPEIAYFCFQKVDHEIFKLNQEKKIVDDSSCSTDPLLAPNSLFVEHGESTCAIAQSLMKGDSCKVGCVPGYVGPEKIYTCQKSGSWNYDTPELLQPFKVSCRTQTKIDDEAAEKEKIGSRIARAFEPTARYGLRAYLVLCGITIFLVMICMVVQLIPLILVVFLFLMII